jgi:hypothetical protein
MKRRILIVFFLFSTCLPSFSQVFKQSIDSIATIDFPGKPDISDTMGYRVYNFAIGTEHYLLSIRDLFTISSFHLKDEELLDFYNSVIRGILDAAEGKLITKSNFVVSDLKAAEVEFISTSNPLLPDLRFSRLIFVNKKMIIYSFWTTSANKATTAIQRSNFLNSIRFSSNKSNLKQSTED